MLRIEKENNFGIDHGDMKWLLKATSKDKMREVLVNYLYVKNSFMYATDGHRLHRLTLANDSSITDGVYLIASKKDLIIEKAEGINYPPCEQIIPTQFAVEKEVFRGFNLFVTQIIRLLPTDKTVNIDYLEDAVDFGSKGSTDMNQFKIESGARAGVLLTNGTSRLAFIMPINMGVEWQKN